MIRRWKIPSPDRSAKPKTAVSSGSSAGGASPGSPGSPDDAGKDTRGRLAALAVTVASAIIVITCNTGREHPLPPPASPIPPLPADPPGGMASALAAPDAAPAEAEIAPDAAAEAPPPSASALADASPPRGPGRELAGFYGALRGLEKHTRAEHVRIVWLGDSHGAADIWPGALRAQLQKRFGNGGFGFVHIGARGYRHEGIKLESPVKWLMHPKNPATSVAQGDGILGLSGILMYSDEASPRASITVADQAIPLPPTLHWDLCYKLESPRDEITVKLTGAKTTTVKASAAEPPGALRHLLLTSSGASPTLSVAPAGGFPDLCGVVVEADPKTQPGVIVDTLGINGARMTTPLAWNEASWISELSRRMPALVILEYGTNESSDHLIKPDQYVSRLNRLMARVHSASPDADCMVLAPTDRADTPERTPLVRDALKEAARAAGCGFWDTYSVMGGKGSILKWRAEQPPRAGPDGVHLNAKGYRELGDQLAMDILRGYSP